MPDTLYDLIDSADLMEIGDKSIRGFGIDVDGVDEDEGDDAICLHIEVADEDFGKCAWLFSIKELKEASFNARTKSWTVTYGNDAYPIEIRLFTSAQILPSGY